MPANHAFENTTVIVQTGLYGLVRHPMYSSLLFLAWGAFLKDINLVNIFLVGGVTFFIGATGKVEEAENIKFFGEQYRHYLNKTKAFIPWSY